MRRRRRRWESAGFLKRTSRGKEQHSFFSELVEWFAANPRFEKLLVRVSSRARVLLAFADAVAVELEDGCAQHEAGAGGGGGLAGIAQWER